MASVRLPLVINRKNPYIVRVAIVICTLVLSQICYKGLYVNNQNCSPGNRYVVMSKRKPLIQKSTLDHRKTDGMPACFGQNVRNGFYTNLFRDKTNMYFFISFVSILKQDNLPPLFKHLL